MTEVMGAAFLSDPSDPVKGHSGGPVPSVEFRLRDIPDMNYLSTFNISFNPPKVNCVSEVILSLLVILNAMKSFKVLFYVIYASGFLPHRRRCCLAAYKWHKSY
eukprot:GHVP01020311.1.p1 GENE.GHVP01020311.1~~GHVP01020311.1.p1  ORF type:complete len:104 (+),score=4.55 GHVP01020311.1:119-430(+)